MVEKPVSPIAVANHLLRLGGKCKVADLTPLKLVKLVYLCHAWYLGILKRPLVNERVQAWRFGPAFPSIYKQTKNFTSTPVPYPIGRGKSYALSPSQKRLIGIVFKHYRRFTALQLSEMTHRDETPWGKVWNKTPNQNAIIGNDRIQEYYEEKLGG